MRKSILLFCCFTAAAMTLHATEYKPLGLKNPGNACYLNGLIQSLINLTPLTDILLSNQIDQETRIPFNEYATLARIYETNRFNTSDELKPELEEQLSNQLDILYAAIKWLFTQRGKPLNTGQQDATEVFGKLVKFYDGSECGTILNAIGTNNVGTLNRSLEYWNRTMGESMLSKEAIVDRCLALNNPVFAKVRRFFEHTITTPDTNQAISEVVLNLLAPNGTKDDTPLETLLESNLGRWGGLQFGLDKNVGDCLAIQVNRNIIEGIDEFGFPAGRKVSIKIPESLDIRPFIIGSPKEGDYAYQLVSVTSHYGTEFSGHYVAFVKNLADTKQHWYRCDDRLISPKEFSNCSTEINKEGYLLFYVRKSLVNFLRTHAEARAKHFQNLVKREIKPRPKSTITSESKKALATLNPLDNLSRSLKQLAEKQG